MAEEKFDTNNYKEKFYTLLSNLEKETSTMVDAAVSTFTEQMKNMEPFTFSTHSTPFVSVNPRILSGVPCLNGTRLPVYVVAESVWASKNGVQEAMDLWKVSREDVLTACWYVGAYGLLHILPPVEYGEDPYKLNREYAEDPISKKWLKRWRKWAEENHTRLWAGEYSEIPDPPHKNAGKKK